ncbi:MAG: hypothetical protein C4527_00055 [Candidatus Omnitrophota bacterium]|jgi:tetratricopeptide (TPR) repeat protein|nr:MAG: hypothetical protein C4527_00055 [Candidatus Omnitrophota bacterium]
MDIQNYIAQARKAIQEGEFDLAERYFKQVQSSFPQNPDVLQGFREIEIARAQKTWSPVTWWIKFAWAFLLKNVGQYEKAYRELDILHHCKPQNAAAASNFAGCAEKVGRLDEAHEAYQKILSINATNLSALKADAELLAHMDQLDEAVKHYQRLESLRPKDDRISHRLRDLTARAYARVGIPENLKERRAKIEKEKREAPGAPEFMEKLNKMLAAFKEDPTKKEVGVEIAAHYRQGKLYDDANRYLAQILDKNPDYEPARREQARVWRQSGELAIAVNLLEELLALHPHDQAIKDEYLDASIALLQQEMEQGQDVKEKSIRLERLILDREKNRISMLTNHLVEHPESDKERAELGELLLKHGRIEDAISTLQRLIHTPGWAGRGFYLLGQCFRAQGDRPLAITQFEKALDFFKNRGYSHIPSEELKAVYYYMGQCKDELGDKKGAREAYGNIYSADINYRDVRQRYEATFK